MELRQLEAFVAVATELHFGRAAAGLHMGQPSVSEAVRRLERELGTPLFTRTTRRVALTSAGQELLGRSTRLLAEVAASAAAVKRVGGGDAGTVRVGMTPPVAPVLAPHLLAAAERALPGVEVELRRMWLPALTAAVGDGSIDVALSCGLLPEAGGVVSEVFCGERLLVGLRPDHPRATQETVALADLANEVLGQPDDALFPAWARAQQQALAEAGVAPPTATLTGSDVAAADWVEQTAVDWVLLTGSLAGSHRGTAVRPVEPLQWLPFTLQWNPDRAQTAAVARFVDLVLTEPPPAGWATLADHLQHATG